MKITGIEAFNIGVRLKKPLTIAKMARERSSNTIVRVATDAGLIGFGEATFAHFFAGETQDSVKSVVDTFLGPALAGMDPQNILCAIDEMNRVIAGNPFAKAAVEMALWDIKGKALGVPVYALLGGSRRKSIPVAHSIGTGPAAQMVEQAVEHVRQGFKTLKIYCGKEAPESDLERIREIRRTVGDEISLYIELNQRWTFKTTLALLPPLKELGILFLEQPLPGHLRQEMRILRQSSSLPIALDESIFSPEDVAFAREQGLADIMNVYVLKAGGVLNAKRAADVSEAVGLDCFIGSFNELGVSTMAGAHVAATLPRVVYPCYLVGPTLYQEDILTEPLDIRNGMFHLSDAPGLGIKVDEEKLKRFSG
jgi:muconate cycloisomerase